MIHPAFIVLAVSLVVLCGLTAVCYFGDGTYYHRKRIGAVPYIWMGVFAVGSFWIGAALDMPYAALFVALVVSTVMGGFLGWLFIERFGYDAIYRLERIALRRANERRAAQGLRPLQRL